MREKQCQKDMNPRRKVNHKNAKLRTRTLLLIINVTQAIFLKSSTVLQKRGNNSVKLVYVAFNHGEVSQLTNINDIP